MTAFTRRLGLACTVAALLSACGGSDGPTAPRTADLNGTWRIAFNNLSGSGITCSTTGIDYVITQTGKTFTATSTSTYLFSCTDGIESLSDTLVGAVITNGHVEGSAIEFDLATSSAHQSGTVSGNSVSGTATWTLDLGSSGTLVLSGQFGGLKL